MKEKKKYIVFWGSVLMILLLIYIISSHAAKKEESVTGISYAMGTVIKQTVYGENGQAVMEQVTKTVGDLDKVYLSWREENSMTAQINESQEESFEADEAFCFWLSQTLELAEKSNGALDPTIRPLVKLWGIEGEYPQVPADTELEEALTHVDYHGVEINQDTITFSDGNISLDFGAVGKGIALDEIKAVLEQEQVTGAAIAVGGSILYYGEKPDGTNWTVGIRDPNGEEGSVMGILTLKEPACVSTSGSYEKYFQEDGVLYHHILNPKTGYPADSGLLSVTVICENGLASDGLSTACFILGIEGSQDLLEAYHAEAIFIDEDNKVYVTEGIKENFVITQDAYEKE